LKKKGYWKNYFPPTVTRNNKPTCIAKKKYHPLQFFSSDGIISFQWKVFFEQQKEKRVKTYAIIIRGRVQGVSFRWESKKKASQLGIKGYVRNEYDGSVYIHAEGDEKKLKTFMEWCGKGPETARVETLEIQEIKYKGYNNFEIKI
jgi:acylphosphatase